MTDFPQILAFINIGTTELLVIAALGLLLFGADRIPEIARQLGRAKAEFTRAATEFEHTLEEKKGIAAKPGDAVPREHTRDVERLEEERLRRAARELGIDDAGKGSEELRELIGRRMTN